MPYRFKLVITTIPESVRYNVESVAKHYGYTPKSSYVYFKHVDCLPIPIPRHIGYD